MIHLALAGGQPGVHAVLAGALARRILPPYVSLAAPPGITDPWVLYALRDAGLEPAHLPEPTGEEAELDLGALPFVPGADGARVLCDAIAERLSFAAENLALPPALGVLGGSGFYDLPGLEDVEDFEVETPFGPPSGPVRQGWLDGRRVVFLARHGLHHTLLPGEVNARANVYALKRMGVTRVISVSAVGSLREEIAPGDVVLPRQFLDRTSGRPATLFGGGVVAHASLADPVCGDLADALAGFAARRGHRVHADGTYVCIEGPQFSTRAESAFHRSLGADVVGMTNLPEARLAREAELCWATLTLPTDWDCWRPKDEVVAVDVLATLQANVATARGIVADALRAVPTGPCACQRTLDAALITPTGAIPAAARLRLHPVLARRLAAG